MHADNSFENLRFSAPQVCGSILILDRVYYVYGSQVRDSAMLVSQRFDFSCAHYLPGSADGRERRVHGHDYSLWASVSGPLDPDSGLVASLPALRAEVREGLKRYDSQLLNDVLEGEPVVERLAEVLWADIAPRLHDPPLALLSLWEEAGAGAEAGPQGAHALAEGLFPAAHRSHIPTYSAQANRALFGICNNPAGHGHNYRVLVSAAPPTAALEDALWLALTEFDHMNLSVDIPDLAGRSVSTEAIARLLWVRLAGSGLRRLRLYELPGFFAEYKGNGDMAWLGRRYYFAAAHAPARPGLSRAENEARYGNCGRPGLHGHSYQVEVTVAGRVDAVTGLVMDLNDMDRLAAEAVGLLDRRQLEDLPAFRDKPATGANVLAHLWRELAERFGAALARVRLWETREVCYEREPDSG
jgi:6-pyruvoyltetrahydropterin/6-carboxytetrahydropterin synthase